MKKNVNGPNDRFKKRLEEEYNNLEEEERRLQEQAESYLKAAIEEENSNSEDSSESLEEEEKDEEEREEDEEEKEEEDNEEEEEEDEEEEEGDEEEEKEKDEEEENPAKKEGEDNETKKGSQENEKDLQDRESRKSLGPQRGSPSEDSSLPDSSKSVGGKIVDSATKHVVENNETLQKAAKVKEAATAAAGLAKSAVASLGIFMKLLINPFFWVGVAVVIFMIAMVSANSIIGGNDYNKVCDSNGVGQISVDDDVDDFTRQSGIASWLMSTPFEAMGGKPFTREQAMGIMGNLIEESYGANPKTIQDDHTMTRWQVCDNDCVSKFKGGGQAIGILQWDGAAGDPRRDNLVALAKSEGTQWYDLNVQLKHLKMEIDAEGSHTYENYMLKRSGFLNPGKSVEEYTRLWAKNIERCGQCRMEARYKSAKEFDSKYQGGGSIGGSAGLSSQCIGSAGSGTVDASSLRALAESIAYTRAERAAGVGKGTCPGGLVNCGMPFSKPEYKQAKDMAVEVGGVDPYSNLLASCDRLVATMVKVTGMDESFPWGDAITQVNHMIKSPDWKEVSCQDRQPGDVFGQKDHIMIYVGDTNDGPDTMVSASYMNRSAHMATVACSGDLWSGDGVKVRGWRKVK